jgi:hypothetical protein
MGLGRCMEGGDWGSWGKGMGRIGRSSLGDGFRVDKDWMGFV